MRKIIEKELDHIEIPQELNERSKIGIQRARLEIKEGNKMNKYTKKVAGVAAIFVLSVGLIAVNNSTLANPIKGFFKDITNWDGTITGTKYEEATKEINVKILSPIVESNKILIPIEVIFENSDEPPFNDIEALTVGNLKITDYLGNKINGIKIEINSDVNKDYGFEIREEENLLEEIKNIESNNRKFKANLVMNKEQIDSDYKLIIESFYGHKKADAPIEIKGNWELDFTLQ